MAPIMEYYRKFRRVLRPVSAVWTIAALCCGNARYGLLTTRTIHEPVAGKGSSAIELTRHAVLVLVAYCSQSRGAVCDGPSASADASASPLMPTPTRAWRRTCVLAA